MTSSSRTPTERTRLVARYRESGLTQQAFADREGIPLSTLRNWLYRSSSPRASFVELRAAAPATPSKVELVVGGIRILVSDDRAAEQTAAIVRALLADEARR